MNARRGFLKLCPALAAIPAIASNRNGSDYGDEPNALLGSWSSIHTLPFPPDTFREFLSFAAGGVLAETNAFLHNTSNLDFSNFGLPSPISASDGVGTWKPLQANHAEVEFRKFMFDSSKVNFADLLVKGTVRVTGRTLSATWTTLQVVDVNTGAVLAEFPKQPAKELASAECTYCFVDVGLLDSSKNSFCKRGAT